MVYNEEFENVLKDLVTNHPRSYFKTIKAKSNSNLLNYIISCTPLLDGYNISTRTYWTINRLTSFPKCKICGKEMKQDIKINEGYPTYCSHKCVMSDPDYIKKVSENIEMKYGKGVTNVFQIDEIKDKITKTNLEKYGCKRYTQTQEYRDKVRAMQPEIREKVNETHLDNNSFNTSRTEDEVYEIIRRKYPETIHCYNSCVYPFQIDFYIPTIDLYVDFNGTWTHNTHPFNEKDKNDLEKLEEWKNKHTKFYDNAIYTWTDLDVRKREYAKSHNINRIELWNAKEVYKWLYGNCEISKKLDLVVEFNRKKFDYEMDYYKNTIPDHIFPPPTNNYIIKYFQQDTFYKKEKEIWKNNEEKRLKLIENRLKYLNKPENELTTMDILSGFKRSGMFYGYSHFNPLWFKWFISKYGVKVCYDPCGGWGHRLLGSMDLEKYIYNDLSKTTRENVDRIIRYFNITNTETHNEDARSFVPEDNFDAMFTCPPYFNLEHYECGDFEDEDEYRSFIDSIFKTYNEKDSCNVFGLVTREDMIYSHIDYTEKIPLNVGKSDHLVTEKSCEEYIFIYKKDVNILDEQHIGNKRD